MSDDMHGVTTTPDEPLPPDPPGWEIRLTDKGQWQPVNMETGEALEAAPTKIEAVRAISI